MTVSKTTKKHIVFNFNLKSLGVLYSLNEAWMSRSYGATLSLCLRIYKTLWRQRSDGFTQLIVRNPKTGAERELLWRQQ